MAKSSADDGDLRRACEAAIEDTKQKIVMALRVAKGHGILGKSSKLGRQMAKPRVLALSSYLSLIPSLQFSVPLFPMLATFILLARDSTNVLAFKELN